MADAAPARRVLFVINDLARAGAETQLVRLALALPATRYERRIVLLKERNDFAEALAGAGVPVRALRRGRLGLGALASLWREVRGFRPHVVHSFLFPANLVAALAARAAGTPRVVVSQRSSYEATLPAPWRRLARAGHRLAHRVLVNSRAALAEEVAAGLPAARLRHVPNAARPVAAARDRAALGLGQGPLVLSLGQLAPEKGHAVLLEAWAEVWARRPEARLLLLGDGPCRPALEAQAVRLGLAGSVSFLGFRPDPDPYLAACDLLVQPSLTEGLPNAVLEAMSAGRPVVASRVGGLPELVVEGETGWLVPPADARALAHAVLEALGAPERSAAMGRTGAERARLQFSMEAVRAAVEEAYSD